MSDIYDFVYKSSVPQIVERIAELKAKEQHYLETIELLNREVEVVKGELEMWQRGHVPALLAQAAKIHEYVCEIVELEAMLRESEWVGFGVCCYSCGMQKSEGHDKGCRLAKLLKGGG